MFKEFKEFALRGNVLDLAVGMIIGAAFTSIVKGLVDNLLSPVLALLTAGVKLDHWKILLAGQGKTAVTLNIGAFLQSVVSFIIVAFAVFLLVKAIRSFEKKEEVKPSVSLAPSKSEVLLEEIRDLLKEK